MTNEQLIMVIRDGDADNSKSMELWNQNAGLIHKACIKYAGVIEKEDALQECFIAFLDAVHDFDPSAGQAFAGYVYDRCRWHLYRYRENCSGLIRMPANQRQTLNKYRRFVREMYQEHGALPDDLEICRAIQVNPGQLKQLRKDMQTVDVKSLEEPLNNDTEALTAADTVPDTSVNVEDDIIERMQDQERRRAVWAAVGTLSPDDGKALRLYYLEGLTYSRIAESMGIDQQKVRTCIARGLRQLRTGKQGRILREYIDIVPENYMRGSSLSAFNRTWTSCTESAALRRLEAMETQIRKELQRIRRHPLPDQHKKAAGDIPTAKQPRTKPCEAL